MNHVITKDDLSKIIHEIVIAPIVICLNCNGKKLVTSLTTVLLILLLCIVTNKSLISESNTIRVRHLPRVIELFVCFHV